MEVCCSGGPGDGARTAKTRHHPAGDGHRVWTSRRRQGKVHLSSHARQLPSSRGITTRPRQQRLLIPVCFCHCQQPNPFAGKMQELTDAFQESGDF